ncbi:hypothetical protein BOC52_02600 [Burkholderia pseudomallei]|nr:hypothetical protein BOC52_02600 [Burkholderia pseudomallei]ARL62988.1 hypothetical protein BOC53_05280 [Burkholderia pseudomallei]
MPLRGARSGERSGDAHRVRRAGGFAGPPAGRADGGRPAARVADRRRRSPRARQAVASPAAGNGSA